MHGVAPNDLVAINLSPGRGGDSICPLVIMGKKVQLGPLS